jgi:histidyl-tRNA synthetase
MKVLPMTTEMFFKRSIGVAEHYGFRNVDDLRQEATKKGTNVLGLSKCKSPDPNIEHHVLAQVLETCSEAIELQSKQPLMFYTPSIVSHPTKPSVRISALTLNAIGTGDPLAEVVVLKSVLSILQELGIKDVRLRINSIGDSDSSARFLREVSNHIRAQMDSLPRAIANGMRSNPGSTLAQLFAEDHEFVQSLPSPLEFLTTPSRKYFKEVLELLENTGIKFELADRLYADPNVYSHTIFEIVEDNDDELPPTTLGRGGRYDELTRPYARNTIPSTGLVLAVRTKDRRASVGRPRRKRPTACLIHIGREARIQSIAIVETLRNEKIPIEQCLHFERFSEQMAYAQAQSTKYVIIVGQREARDGVVLIRNTMDRSQQTVPIAKLPTVLRTLQTR